MKGCIFDLDGTLTDTLESLTYSVQLTLKEMELSPITSEQCRCFVGNGAKVLMEKALKAAGDDDASRLEEGMEIYRRIFDENCTYHVKPYEGLLPVLERMKEQGIRLAVLSNKPHQQAVKVVEWVFGANFFDYTAGQQEKISRKPDPAGVNCILERLGVKTKECLYVGDSEVDILTGKNAGIQTISVSWGFRTRKELEESGAGTIIEKPEELLQFI